MNENSPLPPLGGATCPNCGAAQDANAPYCTNCGAPMQAATSPGSLSQTGKTLATLALGCGALLFGGLGGCLALIGVMGGSFSTDWPYVLVAIVVLLAAAACIWGISRVQSKK